MSNEELKTDVLKSYTHDYKVDGAPRSVEFRPWNLMNAPKNIAIVGKMVVRVRKERPDISLQNILENWDILLQEAPEDIVKLIRNSLPRRMNEQDKDLFLESNDLADAIELVGVLVKQNFFSEKVKKAFDKLMGDIEGNKDETTEQTGQES